MGLCRSAQREVWALSKRTRGLSRVEMRGRWREGRVGTDRGGRASLSLAARGRAGKKELLAQETTSRGVNNVGTGMRVFK